MREGLLVLSTLYSLVALILSAYAVYFRRTPQLITVRKRVRMQEPHQERLAEINRRVEERYGKRWWVPRMEMARDEAGRLLLRWRDTTGNVCLEASLEGDSLNIRRGWTTQPGVNQP